MSLNSLNLNSLTPGSDVAAFMNDEMQISHVYMNIMTTAGEILCQHQEALLNTY